MAKKKKRKDTKSKLTPLHYELIGVGVVILSVVAIGRFGLVGEILQNFSKFLVGSSYALVPIVAFLVGGQMIIKRKPFNFADNKLIGWYLIGSAWLIYSHTGYISDLEDVSGFEIINRTFDNFMLAQAQPNAIAGGGFIGAIFSMVLIQLFQIQGAYLVAFAILIVGLSLATSKSMFEWMRKGFQKLTIKKSSKDPFGWIKAYIKPKPKGPKKDNVVINESKPSRKVFHEIDYDDQEPMVEIPFVNEVVNTSEEREIIVNEAKETVKVNPIIQTDFTTVPSAKYNLPPVYLLENSMNKNKGHQSDNNAYARSNIQKLEQVLADFGVNAKIVALNIGPTVTQYELELQSGVKVSKVVSLSKEIALALAAKDVRIQAPIPGKSTIGIEIPNKQNNMVTLREVLEEESKESLDSKLLFGLGKDIMGNAVQYELNRMPHLLVAGATGSGKSVCINAIIVSILMRAKPDEVKFIMIDPKKVELNGYNGIPHLLMPVVTDPRKASVALRKVVAEMERRYELFSESGTRNIASYNAYIESKNDPNYSKIPYYVVIIDELADLMLVASKEVEDSIMRITQMARAAGIHLIVATQRPSTDVITGVIKANIPSRIAFAVSSSIDSRTILDMMGAEKLLGKGDMLFLPMGENAPIRIQGCFLSDEEVNKVVEFAVKQQKAVYDQNMMNLEAIALANDSENVQIDDHIYEQVVRYVKETQKASASLLQRRFKIGYNRAARLIDLLEEQGIIGPQNGSKPREVLIDHELLGEDE